MVCSMPGTPTDVPQAGIGPSTPALVAVLTSDASARIWPVFTSITTATPVSAVGRAKLCGQRALGDELQRRVDGQFEAHAGLRGLDDAAVGARQSDARGRDELARDARPARQTGLELVLQPGRSRSRGVGAAKQ